MKIAVRQSACATTVLVLLTLLAYMPAVRGNFVWDDDAYVTKNPTLTSAQGLSRIWFEPSSSPQYYPMVFTTFWLENHLWGLNPVGYHLVSIFLHVLGTALLWHLLVRLGIRGAWVAAMIFALHPVQVESVAWITERKNVLSGVFYFASALCLVRFFGLERGKGERPHLPPLYVAGSLLFLCALLSKTVTCSLPASIVMLLWWKNGRVKKTEAFMLLPLFVLGLGFGLFTGWLERHHVGAMGTDWAFSHVARFLIAGRALWFYAGKLVWPVELIQVSGGSTSIRSVFWSSCLCCGYGVSLWGVVRLWGCCFSSGPFSQR